MNASRLRVNRWLLAGAFTAMALIVSSLLAGALLAYYQSEEANLPPGDFSNEGSFTSYAARELRLSLSDLFWLKTEEYIHDGVQHRPHDEHDHSDDDHHEEPEHVHTEDCDHDSEHHPQPLLGKEGSKVILPLSKGELEGVSSQEHYDHQGIPLKQNDANVVGLAHDCEDHGGTLIPSRANDFRGFLGDLHRETQPYRGEHRLSTDPLELLPWLKLATLANPHHIRAYRGIAFFLSTYLNRPAEAIQVLQDALTLNPDHPQLLLALGRLHFYERKDPTAARRYFERVIDLWRNDADKKSWESEDQFAVRQSFVHLAYCEMRQDNKDGAIWWCEEGLREFPTAEAVKRYRMRLLGQIPPRRRPARNQVPPTETHSHEHDAENNEI